MECLIFLDGCSADNKGVMFLKYGKLFFYSFEEKRVVYLHNPWFDLTCCLNKRMV